VVATAVGGVEDAIGDAALLVPPGEKETAARALERLRDEAELRESLAAAGIAHVRAHTLEEESKRVAKFICETA
jgi:glycosyltransferase involved in cell wall biosynthesis